MNAFLCVEEIMRVKKLSGRVQLEDARPDGECSEILVSNPDTAYICYAQTTISRKLFVQRL